MRDPNLFNRYAIALLSLAIEQNEAEEYRAEVKLIRNILHENMEFEQVLADVHKTYEEKCEIINKIFGSFKDEIISYIKIIVRNNRAMCLYEIFRETLFRFDDYLKVEEGKIYIASEMDSSEIERITKAIEEKEGVRLELEVVINPEIIGGFIVELKNNVYDSSLKTKLSNLKTNLLGGK